MAEVTGMTPEKIAQEITNVKSYVNGGLSEKADKTYVDSGLSKKADKTYVDSLSPLKSFAGTGSPEGRITAPVGTIYTDTAATNGAIRWIKARGAGNTGWRVEYGDTGWRDISSLLEPGRITINSGGHVHVRRIGVHVVFSLQKITVNAVGLLWSTPAGFGTDPGRDAQVILPDGGSIHLTQYWTRIEDYTPGTDVAVHRAAVSQFLAIQGWPSILPGTPA